MTRIDTEACLPRRVYCMSLLLRRLRHKILRTEVLSLPRGHVEPVKGTICFHSMNVSCSTMTRIDTEACLQRRVYCMSPLLRRLRRKILRTEVSNPVTQPVKETIFFIQ